MQLSKSDYMMFLRHPAWVWLKKHDKSKLPPPDASTEARFEAGHLFEQYPEQLFPKGVSLGFDGYEEYRELTHKTKKALDDGAKTIFQGRFEAEKITCIIDILDRVDGNTFDLYEIKSSTGVKPEHEQDLAFQVVVIESAGLIIRDISVIYVNRNYVREGKIDAEGITTTEKITDKVRLQIPLVKENIKQVIRVVESKERPDISPRYAGMGALNEWLGIYKSLVDDLDAHSIYSLCSPGADRIGALEDLGIKLINEIPEGFKLTKKQERQVEATKTGKRFIDKKKISTFLDAFEYPLYFLDYETFASAIPAFDGIGPYQQVPFQYSLHVLEGPDAEPKHKEYLHTENSNPAEQLIEQLQKDMGKKGSVIVWNEMFERKCNETLAELVPKYKDFLLNVNERIVDLMVPFFKGWFVDKDFFGSASIKNILPVLAPKLSYKELGIQEGGLAQQLWMETVLGGKHEDEKEKIMSDLVKYCGLDSLATVEIWRVLVRI